MAENKPPEFISRTVALWFGCFILLFDAGWLVTVLPTLFAARSPTAVASGVIGSIALVGANVSLIWLLLTSRES